MVSAYPLFHGLADAAFCKGIVHAPGNPAFSGCQVGRVLQEIKMIGVSSQDGLSVLDCFGPVRTDSASRCMKRAVLCSVLAKKSPRRLRSKLYRMKDENIAAALDVNPAAIEVDVDMDLHHGLLSVSLANDPSISVHTHENWLDVERNHGN